MGSGPRHYGDMCVSIWYARQVVQAKIVVPGQRKLVSTTDDLPGVGSVELMVTGWPTAFSLSLNLQRTPCRTGPDGLETARIHQVRPRLVSVHSRILIRLYYSQNTFPLLLRDLDSLQSRFENPRAHARLAGMSTLRPEQNSQSNVPPLSN